MSDKKRVAGLGRGLSALLGEVGASPAMAGINPMAVTITTLPLTHIVANPRQPRRQFDQAALDELTESVKARGLLQPIVVRPRPGGAYEIVAGERRWRAAQAAQLHNVPVVVKLLDDTAAFEVALVENIQRADLNPIEEAEGYRRLIDEFGHTQEALAKLVGKSRSHVANLLRLLDLPPAVRKMVVEGQLTMGHARALLGADDPVALARRIVDEQLSVRQVEALVGGKTHAAPAPKPSPAIAAPRPREWRDPDIIALEQQLAETLGLNVAISYVPGVGSLEIEFSTLDQLDMLCQRLLGEERF